MLKQWKHVNVKKEILGGVTSFFAISYVIVVNSLILAEAGIPPEFSVFGTIFISVIGCLAIGLLGNVPLVITTGMGVNSFFTYTLVVSLKLTWQQALAVSFTASLVCLLIALTPIADKMNDAIPDSLKHGITSGIGIFLVLVGLEKGEIIVRGEQTFMTLNKFNSPELLLTLGALILTLFLFLKKIQGSFFIGIIAATVIANMLHLVDGEQNKFSLSAISHYGSIVGKLDFSAFFSIEFFLGVFSLAMILIFESIGLFNGLLPGLSKERFRKMFVVNSVVMMLSSVLGTSPTIPAAESSTGIQEGAKTGLMAVTAGLLFFASTFMIPLLGFIPYSALAPAIIITGCLMMGNIRLIDLTEFTDWFPSFLMIVMMAFSMSISDGLAFGFAAYPLVKLFGGKRKEVSSTVWVISFLFFLYLLAKIWI
ncbi:NCS2 family permease [Vagococcus elongatus]|uniref:Permease n=1 Tax=Vagococcus elongatus TaxID=180344 RepID=A0A430B451_9ENTE|nr:NCS2 family permease [Vagococcus elongatus]RSU15136.1 permease [Vagococcus elongatus]